VDIGKIEGLNPSHDGPVPFDIAIDEVDWTVEIGLVRYERKISDFPHLFSKGRIIVEGQCCWVCLRRLEIISLD